MTVCYFGTYLRDYSRNRIIIKGLKKNDVQIKECHAELWSNTKERLKEFSGFIRKLILIKRILSCYVLLIKRYRQIGDYDVMFVGYTGHFDIFLARFLAGLRRRPLFFDAFVSLYDTFVDDRQLVSSRSLLGRFLRWVDRKSCMLADKVLLDTNEQIEYFRKKLALTDVRFHRIWVGAEDGLFYPGPEKDDDSFVVLFYGSLIPLQGAEVILEAAKILETHSDMRFEIVGSGQLSKKIAALAESLNLTNVSFIEWVDYEKLPKKIGESEVCLGIFGNTSKARRVIPNKVYQALAMRKPVITGDSPAAREALIHGENAVLCKMGDPGQLAEAILSLKKDPLLRRKIAENGHSLFKSHFTTEKIGRMVKGLISQSVACE